MIPHLAIRDLWAQTKDVLSDRPSLGVFVVLENNVAADISLLAELYDETTLVQTVTQAKHLASGTHTVMLHMEGLRGIKLWSPERPSLYQLAVSLLVGAKKSHAVSLRIGFCEAQVELNGFYLNGERTRLFGLNRHELFPYVGVASSKRTMRHDAAYLRNVLNCNIVRCSHYPQSPAFLDACDEMG